MLLFAWGLHAVRNASEYIFFDRDARRHSPAPQVKQKSDFKWSTTHQSESSSLQRTRLSKPMTRGFGDGRQVASPNPPRIDHTHALMVINMRFCHLWRVLKQTRNLPSDPRRQIAPPSGVRSTGQSPHSTTTGKCFSRKASRFWKMYF